MGFSPAIAGRKTLQCHFIRQMKPLTLSSISSWHHQYFINSMHIFQAGRGSFLEFLRNLTPQVLIFSIGIVAGYKLEPTCCYPENLKQTCIFICFISIGFAAIWANCSLFIENYLISFKRIGRASKLLNSLGVSGTRNLHALIKHTWRKRRIVFIELVIVFVLVEFGLVVVLFTAVSTSVSVLKTIHG